LTGLEEGVGCAIGREADGFGGIGDEIGLEASVSAMMLLKSTLLISLHFDHQRVYNAFQSALTAQILPSLISKAPDPVSMEYSDYANPMA
jgi:hypothetical protein